VAVMAWKLLNQSGPSDNQGKSSSVGINDATANGTGFYPLTMPLTVGPGSIATAISLVVGAKNSKEFDFAVEMPSIVGGFLGLLALSISIYLIYKESSGIKRIFGVNGTNVMMRLFAFILLAIGVQIFLGGLEGFALDVYNKLPPR
jgi:multiple antibiotic resistance protein